MMRAEVGGALDEGMMDGDRRVHLSSAASAVLPGLLGLCRMMQKVVHWGQKVYSALFLPFA